MRCFHSRDQKRQASLPRHFYCYFYLTTTNPLRYAMPCYAGYQNFIKLFRQRAFLSRRTSRSSAYSPGLAET